MANKQDTITPKYATLLYEVRKTLDISVGEYFYIDMMHYLSHGGWCYKSLESIASDIGITKRGVMKLRDRMIQRGFIEKNALGHVRTTAKYKHALIANVSGEQSSPAVVNKVPKAVNKVHLSGEQSSTKSYIRNTENIKAVNPDEKKDHRGKYSANKERIREMLRNKKLGDSKAT